MKTYAKVLTMVLVVLLALSTMPQNVCAAITSAPVQHAGAADGKSNNKVETPDAAPEPDVISEDTSKRTEFSKEFLRSDSSRLLVLYPEAVHYQNGDRWEDVDNTLKSVTDKDGNIVLENTASSIDIKLPSTFEPGRPVSITKGDFTLSFVLDGTYAPIQSVKKEKDTAFIKGLSDNQKKAVPTKTESSVVYNDVLPNIDIQYFIKPEQLKESVIVKACPVEPFTYSYTITANLMEPVLQDDKSILFYPIGKTDEDPVFIMPAPCMIDKKGETSYEVAVGLETIDGAFRVTYTPSMEWLSDSKRAYPVDIDPVVVADLDINNIRDQQVDSNKNDVSYTSSYIEAGRHTTYGKERIYMMYANLPALSSADVVVDAYVQIYRSYDSTLVSQMEVHKVNATWDDTNLQWSNQPAFNTSVDDYTMVQNAGWYTWHITDIARGWYAGSNTGMMFKMPDAIENGTASNNKTFYSSDNGTGNRPILYIAFRNNCGREDYWNYHSQDVGRAGTGYINDYTGNLVFEHDDIGFDGNIMPVSIKHIYNANDKILNTYGCGYGWRTNYNERIYQWQVDSDYYVWEDSDGTRHYFLYSAANTYLDEDGLFLTLKDNETGNYLYSITDNLGNKRYFDSYGRLKRIQNNQSTADHIDITYTSASGPYILTVTDGVGRLYQFAYNGANLIRIEYKGTGSTVLQDIDFVYNASTELSTITYYDAETTTYAYTSNHLLNRATDIDGYYVSYTYNTTSTSIPNRVSSLAYYDNAVAGDTLTMAYSQNQTTFTDYQGRKITEQFNNRGNTTCIQDDQGNAQYAQYSGTVSNQLSLSSKLQNTIQNFLKNGGAEYTDGWTLVTAGSPTGSWSYSTAYKYIGTKSAAITRTDEAGTYRLSQNITLAKGKTYTFSAWVKTTGMNNTGNGTYLAIENQDVSGHYIIAKSEIIKTTTSASDPNTDANGWRRVEATLAIPADSYSSTVTFSTYQSTIGTAYYDCLQAEEAPAASRYNLVENGDFLYQGSTASDALYWAETNLATTDIRTTSSPAGCPRLSTSCFSITGSPTTNKNINQIVTISGAAGDVFTVAGWAKGKAAPTIGTRYYALIMQLYHVDNTYDYVRVLYNPDVDTWQYGSGKVTATQAYTRFQIYACYYGEVNTVCFDGIQVYRQEFGTSYTYDANGNVTNVGAINNDGTQNNSNTAIAYTNNNPTTVTDPDGNVTTNGFDSNHNQTSTTTPNEKDTTAVATNGNVTSDKEVDPDNASAPTIENSTTYTADGNYTATTTDESRHTSTYDYNLQRGTLNWLQAPNDTSSTRTSYNYDTINRMTGVSKPVSGLYNGVAQMTNAYTYEDDQIKTISHNNTTSGNDTTYTFNYGDMRTLTNVQVGSGTPRTLVTNTYDTSNRSYNLTRATYGNSQWVNYTYDSRNRITGIKFNNDSADRFTLMYNNAGGIGSLTDNSNNLFTKYIYDMADNLQSVSETGVNGRSYSHFYSWGFDVNRNVTSFMEKLNGSTWTTNYVYDGDNRLTDAAFSYGSRTSKTSWIYDDYGRVAERDVYDNNTTQIFDTLNTFINPDATHTSNLVSTVRNKRHTAGGYDKTLTYQYDANSNITSVSDGTNTISYLYDSANQLVRENNQAAGKTWTWLYDAGGNIRQKNEYAYTTGTLGTVLISIPYSYTDANGWGDLMTSYNGNTITYDGLGNPTNDGTWTYTWQGGRNLVGLSKTGTTASYTYNKDGIRTSKTVNGTTTTYTLVDGRVTHETNGTNSIYYRFDSNDKLISMNLNGTEYYYFRNAQDDIAGLFDTAGSVVVEYAYDAWGNILSTEGTLASTVGVANPYRYRGYRFDNESGLYYLRSRYYNPIYSRFINSDLVVVGGINLYRYCQNNPVNYDDPSGFMAIAAVATMFAGDVGLGLSGIALLTKLTAFLAPLFPYLLIIIAVVVTAYLVYVAVNYAMMHATKSLSNTKSRRPGSNDRVYQFAYVNTKTGCLIKVGGKMTFDEAVAALALSGVANAIANTLLSKHKNYWGIYTHDQAHARALALHFGCTSAPEVHGSGWYGHYHSSNHKFHIWYDGTIKYR